MNVFFSVDNFAIAKVLFNEEENSLYFLIFTYKMIKYGNRTTTVEQNWDILEILVRMKRCTITFKFDFLRRKSPSLISTRIIHIGYEQRGAK